MTNESANPMRLSNSFYDKLKIAATVVIPALATLYFALGNIWGFPYIEQVLGSAVAIETFLGALLGLSTRAYKQEKKERGDHLVVSPDGDVYAEFGADPKYLGDGESVEMVVVKSQ